VTESPTAYRFVIGPRRIARRRWELRRLPGDLVLSAGRWDDVWAACPEFGVPWRNVEIDPTVRDDVLIEWGTHPDFTA
jgi:hypothetical protein